MNIEYHKRWSSNLEREMELKIYGQTGKPVLIFPSMNGRYYEYEDFGMVDAVSEFIDRGKVQLFAVDSVDGESWANWNANPSERASRHEQYDRYILQEVMPFIKEKNRSRIVAMSFCEPRS